MHVGSGTGRSRATGQGAAHAARREDRGVGGSLSAEARILVGLQRVTARPVPLVVARGLDRAGAHAAAWVATAALGACVDARRQADWVRAGAAVFAAHAASVVVKRVARRVRPSHTSLITHVAAPSRWSFPSSHAASTTAAAVVFAPLLGRSVLLLPPAMAWSRMALGVHYPTDVLAGMALGGVAGAASERRRQAVRDR